MELGVSTLPPIAKDSTDRNRTSPFAFTGNKFEFRMLGSNLNISCPNTILNTIVAEELTQFADELECVKKENVIHKALIALIQKTLRNHKRIIFSRNGYSDDWKKEAQKRGLLELKTTADALPHYIWIRIFNYLKNYNVVIHDELHARESILLTNYYQVVSNQLRRWLICCANKSCLQSLAMRLNLCQIIQTKKSSGIDACL